MKLRAALTAALVVPSALALTGPVAPTYAAAAVCQGQPATIEGSTGTITGTEGNDVIVATGLDTDVQALGGNDLICVVGGDVSTGAGDDSVVSTAAAGGFTTRLPVRRHRHLRRRGRASATWSSTRSPSFHVDLGGGGVLELYPTSTPGTGSVDFGPACGYLYAFGVHESQVDLPPRRPASTTSSTSRRSGCATPRPPAARSG